MTNAELIEECDRARLVLDLALHALVAADNAGVLTETIERAYLEAEQDLQNLNNEVEYRLNWEPRPRAWR